MKILQFEDNTEKYMAIRSALDRIGTFDITWVHSVEEGVRYLDDPKKKYDAIITDVQFPIQKAGKPDWCAGEFVIRFEKAYACIWYVDSRNWEEELKQAMKQIARATYQYL